MFAGLQNIPRGQQQQACLEGAAPGSGAGVLSLRSALSQSPYPRNLRRPCQCPGTSWTCSELEREPGQELHWAHPDLSFSLPLRPSSSGNSARDRL